jgi:thymidine phosphorylase
LHSIEDIKAEKSGIVTEIDNRRLAKIANWLVHHTIAGVLLKTFDDKSARRRVILYLFRNERRAKILDRLYEIRKEYYFNKAHEKNIFCFTRNEDLTTFLLKREG